MSLVVDRRKLVDGGLRVTLRGGKRYMAEKLLNGAKIGAIGQQVRGERVTKRMGMQVPVDVIEQRIFFHNHVYEAVGEAAAFLI